MYYLIMRTHTFHISGANIYHISIILRIGLLLPVSKETKHLGVNNHTYLSTYSEKPVAQNFAVKILRSWRISWQVGDA